MSLLLLAVKAILKLFEVHTVTPTVFLFFCFFYADYHIYCAFGANNLNFWDKSDYMSLPCGPIGLKVFPFNLACKLPSDIILYMILKKSGVTPLDYPNTFLLSGV